MMTTFIQNTPYSTYVLHFLIGALIFQRVSLNQYHLMHLQGEFSKQQFTSDHVLSHHNHLLIEITSGPSDM